MSQRPGQENAGASSPSKHARGRSLSPTKRTRQAWFHPQPTPLFSPAPLARPAAAAAASAAADTAPTPTPARAHLPPTHGEPHGLGSEGGGGGAETHGARAGLGAALAMDLAPRTPRKPKPMLGDKSNRSPAKASRPAMRFDMKGNRLPDEDGAAAAAPVQSAPACSPSKSPVRVRLAPHAQAEEWPEVEYMPPKPDPASRGWDVPELAGLPLGDDLVRFIDSISFCPPSSKAEFPLGHSAYGSADLGLAPHFGCGSDTDTDGAPHGAVSALDREAYLGGKPAALFPWDLSWPEHSLSEDSITDDEDDAYRLAQLLGPGTGSDDRVPPPRLPRALHSRTQTRTGTITNHKPDTAPPRSLRPESAQLQRQQQQQQQHRRPPTAASSSAFTTTPAPVAQTRARAHEQQLGPANPALRRAPAPAASQRVLLRPTPRAPPRPTNMPSVSSTAAAGAAAGAGPGPGAMGTTTRAQTKTKTKPTTKPTTKTKTLVPPAPRARARPDALQRSRMVATSAKRSSHGRASISSRLTVQAQAAASAARRQEPNVRLALNVADAFF